MTREGLKEHCLRQVEGCETWARYHGEEPSGQIYEEHKLILELLEQEPCEDAVSRANLLKKFEDRFIELQKAHQADKQLGVNWCINTLKDAPPVTLTRKKGEWIKRNNDYFDWYECSECGYGSDGEMKYNRLCDVRTKFCPDCGSQNLKGE